MTNLIKTEIQSLQNYVDREVHRVEERVETVETRMTEVERKSDYDEATTIIVSGLQQQDGEDVKAVVETLVCTGLGIPDAPVVRAQRMRGRDGRSGIIKAQMRCLEDKKRVLNRKKNLKNQPAYSTVYVKSAASHTERVMERNFHTIMNKIQGCENMFITAHGILVDPDSGDNDGRRGPRRPPRPRRRSQQHQQQHQPQHDRNRDTHL